MTIIRVTIILAEREIHQQHHAHGFDDDSVSVAADGDDMKKS